MKPIVCLYKMIIHPARTSQELLKETSIYPSLWVVLGFGMALAVLSLISYFAGDYPPPPLDLETWIEAWGEFTMLPFINVPAESYRLAQAIFIIPLVFAIWVLMAGSARILSILFGGEASFQQYANLFGFSFFAFWILAAALDTLMSGIFGGFVLAALRMEHGPFVREVVIAFYPVMYTVLFGLGGVYNAIATYQAERFSVLKIILIGMVTFFWPIILVTFLLR